MQNNKPPKKFPLTSSIKHFLVNNYQILTTQQLADSLNVSYGKIQTWLAELNIKKEKVYNRTTEDSIFFRHDKNLVTI